MNQPVDSMIGIFGAGGFGREVMSIHLAAGQAEGEHSVFIDDGLAGGSANGHDIVSLERFFLMKARRHLVSVAVADSRTREMLTDRVLRAGGALATVIAQNAVIGDACTIGPGAVLCPFTYITANVSIGRGFHGNYFSHVAHDCVIGDYVTFAPGVRCNGNVHIADHAYIGSGAILRQGSADQPLRIGKGALVGMGAIVTRDVAAGTTVVGNPARVMLPK